MFRLSTTPTFDRSLEGFIRSHPELKKKIARVILDLEKDPFQPHLRFHPLKGRLEGLCAVSLTYHYRITLILEVHKSEVVLLDIGSHDEVYR